MAAKLLFEAGSNTDSTDAGSDADSTDAGSNTEAACVDGSTPLHHACTRGYTEVVSLLLKWHARLDAEMLRRYTPLHSACANCHVEVVKKLLSAGARVSALTELGQTALHLVCLYGAGHASQHSVVRTLIKACIPVASTDNKGNSALHVACAKGSSSVVGGQNAAGSLPLTLAAESGSLSTVKAGATPTAVNKAGQTAVDLAMAHTGNMHKMLELLKDYAIIATLAPPTA
eukprot:gene3765-13826_t